MSETPTMTDNVGNSRRTYLKPRLEKLGDLRTLTLAYSGGIDESGGTTPRARLPRSLPQPIGVRRPDGSVLLPDGSILLPNGNIVPPS